MCIDSALMPTECLVQEMGGAMRAREGGKWQATLITPGKGSSGVYTEEMLAETGSTAFPKGTKLWFKHPKDDEGAGERDPRDQWGYLEEDAEYVAGEGLVGKIKVLPHWKEVVDSLGEQASLSIYASGLRDEAGAVTLEAAVTNSIDIVSYPGRAGSGLKKKLEAARSASTDRSAASADDTNNQEESVDKKEVEEIVTEALSKALTPINEFITAEAARRQAEEEAAGEAPSAAEAVKAAVKSAEAVKAAKLLPSQEEALLERVANGEDVTEGITAAKKVMQEAAKAVSQAGGTVILGEKAGDTSNDSFDIGVF